MLELLFMDCSEFFRSNLIYLVREEFLLREVWRYYFTFEVPDLSVFLNIFDEPTTKLWRFYVFEVWALNVTF